MPEKDSTLTMKGKTMDYKQAYELAENENSNLRKALAWAAVHMPSDKIKELAKRLVGTIEEGGVVKDASDDCHEENLQIKALCVKAADLLQQVIDANGPVPDAWYGTADDTANRLREFDPPSPEASLVAAGVLDK